MPRKTRSRLRISCGKKADSNEESVWILSKSDDTFQLPIMSSSSSSSSSTTLSHASIPVLPSKSKSISDNSPVLATLENLFNTISLEFKNEKNEETRNSHYIPQEKISHQYSKSQKKIHTNRSNLASKDYLKDSQMYSEKITESNIRRCSFVEDKMMDGDYDRDDKLYCCVSFRRSLDAHLIKKQREPSETSSDNTVLVNDDMTGEKSSWISFEVGDIIENPSASVDTKISTKKQSRKTNLKCTYILPKFALHVNNMDEPLLKKNHDNDPDDDEDRSLPPSSLDLSPGNVTLLDEVVTLRSNLIDVYLDDIDDEDQSIGSKMSLMRCALSIKKLGQYHKVGQSLN